MKAVPRVVDWAERKVVMRDLQSVGTWAVRKEATKDRRRADEWVATME